MCKCQFFKNLEGLEAMGRTGMITVSLLVLLHAQAVGDGPGPGDICQMKVPPLTVVPVTPASPQGLPWVLPRAVCVIVISIRSLTKYPGCL